MDTLNNPRVLATVVVLIDKEGRVILARKKQAIHHAAGEIEYSLGLYNGYGGKMEGIDTTIEDTAIRELYDESSVIAKKEDLTHKTLISFYVNKDGKKHHFMDVYFYLLREWQGQPKEGREMGAPEYFAQDALPYTHMMPADAFIFERLLKGEQGEYDVVLRGKGEEPEIQAKGHMNEPKHINSVVMR